MNKVLLDTDIFSEIGRGVDRTVIQNAMSYHGAFGRYTVSVITVMEIVRGLQKKQAMAQLLTFLGKIGFEEVLDFDQAAAELAGRIQGDLERTGQPIGRADPMIAAIAIQHGMVLITGNTIHYRRIQQLRYPFALDNWRN